MKPKVLLRIAAILIVIHLLGHAIGYLTWDKPTDPNLMEVVRAMKGYRADFMGATKSMADHYNGYGLMIFVIYGMTSSILWLMSGSVATEKKSANGTLYAMAVGYLAFGAIEYVYFFPLAAGISLLAGATTLMAVVKNK